MIPKCPCQITGKSVGFGILTNSDFKFCPMHLNAKQTLNALKALGTIPEPKGGYCFCPGKHDALMTHTGECLAAQKAIKDSQA